MATYDLTLLAPRNLNPGDVLNCPYSGASVALILPPGRYELKCWGAQGGYRSNVTYGGKGGYASGVLSVQEETGFHLYVGGSGNTGGNSGGFNGGGRRASYNGGGGASDIRLRADNLLARVIVAGGGGSDGASNKQGMYGGGESGGSATQSYGSGGYGGTQTGVSSSSWQTSAPSTGTSSQSDAYAGFGFGGNGVSRSSGHGGAGGKAGVKGNQHTETIRGTDDEGNPTTDWVTVIDNYPTEGTPGVDGDSEIARGLLGQGGITMALPSGYTQYEYIESSGTQYIDTGFKPNQDTRVVMKTQLTADASTSWVFGARNSNTDGTIGVFWYPNTNTWSADYDGNSQRYNFPGSIGPLDLIE